MFGYDIYTAVQLVENSHEDNPRSVGDYLEEKEHEDFANMVNLAKELLFGDTTLDETEQAQLEYVKSRMTWYVGREERGG